MQPDEQGLGGASGLVLIVDDDAAIRETLTDLLQEEGYDVVACENGREALTHLASDSRRPNLMLLDMTMPVMNGLELLNELRTIEGHESIAVVVITANDRPFLNAAVPRLPVTIVHKPFSRVTLLRLVADACRARRPSGSLKIESPPPGSRREPGER